MSASDDATLEDVRALAAAGRQLEAYDRARAVLEAGGGRAPLLHQAALLLARCGAPVEAARLLDRHRALCREDDAEIAALRARLLKDRFRRERDPQTGRAARDAYLAVFRKLGGYFSAINAASLSLLLGESEPTRALAREALDDCDRCAATYWQAATRAEALLLLGRWPEAAEALARALLLPDADAVSRNSTFRQFRLLRSALELPDELLAPLRPPAVATFCGHMIHGIGRSAGIDPEDAVEVGRQIEDIFRRERVGFGVGSMACGADLLAAEALLRLGGQLTAVLPFAVEAFVARSVAPAGDEWVRRFYEVWGRASQRLVLAGEPLCDVDVLYELTGRVAMGSARLKAAGLEAEVLQLAIHRGDAVLGAAGTSRDVVTWAETGGRTVSIAPPLPRRGVAPPAPAPASIPAPVRRVLRAMVFADLRGYSALPEGRQALLVPRWLARVGELRDRHSDRVAIVETWGDAAYFVTTTATAAAEIACALTQLTGRELLPEAGDAAAVGLRVSAHAGPVLATDNPALRQQAFFGADVNLAARMEPTAPVGEAYVTEPFAALLMMEGGHRFRCEYVGVQQLAKNYGECRMFHLAQDGL